MGKEWVDFRLVKDTVSMQMVLDRYGIVLKKQGNELRGRCPIHHGEGDRAFHVSVAKNVFNCFSCKARGNVLDLVAALDQCSVRDAALQLKDWFGVRDDTDLQPNKKAGRRSSSPKPLDPPETWQEAEAVGDAAPDKREPTVINPPLGFRLMVNSEHAYGLARGLTKDTLDYYGAGFCRSKETFAGRFVIPLHNETGDLIGYAGRAVDDRVEPKYLFPSNDKGFYKSHVVFNLNRVLENARAAGIRDSEVPVDQAVVVVEGFFPVMALWQHGLRCTISLLGASLSEQQENLLAKYFKRAILLFDGDSAGRSATDDCLSRLGRRCWVKAVSLSDNLQPDQLSCDELTRMLSLV
jgi:DNA primase